MAMADMARQYDVVISHAGEIKPFAAQLAFKLGGDQGFEEASLRLRVLLDKEALKTGDDAEVMMMSLQAPVRVVLLDFVYLIKHWPVRELRRVMEMLTSGQLGMLPVMYNATYSDMNEIMKRLSDPDSSASKGGSRDDAAMQEKQARIAIIQSNTSDVGALLEAISFAVLRRLVEACEKFRDQICSERETIFVSNVHNAVKYVCDDNNFRSLSRRDVNQAKEWLGNLGYLRKKMQQGRGERNAAPPEDPTARIMACHDLADNLELEFAQPGLQRQLELIKKKAEEVGPERWPLALLTMPAAVSEPIWDAMRMLCYYWRKVQRMYNQNRLLHPGDDPAYPDGFFHKRWVVRGREYRMFVEPVDIANWYYKNKHVEALAGDPSMVAGHYVDFFDGRELTPLSEEDNERRPGRYILLQEEEKRVFGSKKVKSSVADGYTFKRLLENKRWQEVISRDPSDSRMGDEGQVNATAHMRDTSAADCDVRLWEVAGAQTSQLLQPPPLPVPSTSSGTTTGAADEDEFLDPVMFHIIVDPVLGNDGCTYDRFTAYRLMTQGSVMPGCNEPFKFGADNVYFRSRLRRAHPETEKAMRRQRQDCVERAQTAFAAREYSTARYWFELIRTWDPATAAGPLTECEAACAAGPSAASVPAGSAPLPALLLPSTRLKQDGEEDTRWWLDDHTKDMLEREMQWPAGADGRLKFTVRDGEPLSSTQEELAKLPTEELMRLRKDYLGAMAECLLTANNDPESEAGKRLVQLVNEMGQWAGAMALTQLTLIPRVPRSGLPPTANNQELALITEEATVQGNQLPLFSTGHSLGGALATLAACDLTKENPDVKLASHTFGAPLTGDWAFGRESNRVVPEPVSMPTKYAPEEKYVEMMRSIKLTGEQRRLLLAMRDLYLRNIGALVQRRQQLSAETQAAQPLGDKQAQVAALHEQTCSTMDKLRETLRDECSFSFQFVLTAWRRVLTPFQVASLTVQSYPGKADILAMINAFAEDIGEPLASEVVRQGAACAKTVLMPVDFAVSAVLDFKPTFMHEAKEPKLQPPVSALVAQPPVFEAEHPETLRSMAKLDIKSQLRSMDSSDSSTGDEGRLSTGADVRNDLNSLIATCATRPLEDYYPLPNCSKGLGALTLLLDSMLKEEPPAELVFPSAWWEEAPQAAHELIAETLMLDYAEGPPCSDAVYFVSKAWARASSGGAMAEGPPAITGTSEQAEAEATESSLGTSGQPSGSGPAGDAASPGITASGSKDKRARKIPAEWCEDCDESHRERLSVQLMPAGAEGFEYECKPNRQIEFADSRHLVARQTFNLPSGFRQSSKAATTVEVVWDMAVCCHRSTGADEHPTGICLRIANFSGTVSELGEGHDRCYLEQVSMDVEAEYSEGTTNWLKVMLDGRDPDCTERVLLEAVVPEDILKAYKGWDYKFSFGPKISVGGVSAEVFTIGAERAAPPPEWNAVAKRGERIVVEECSRRELAKVDIMRHRSGTIMAKAWHRRHSLSINEVRYANDLRRVPKTEVLTLKLKPRAKFFRFKDPKAACVRIATFDRCWQTEFEAYEINVHL